MKLMIGYTDSFISPVTGKIGLNCLSLGRGYVPMGAKNGNVIQSLKVIDNKIDINYLKKYTKAIDDSLDNYLPKTLQNQYLFIGNENGLAEAYANIELNNLPGLSSGKVWQGDNNGRPQEVILNIAPINAPYILKSATDGLDNAQGLTGISDGIAGAIILKIAGGGDGTMQAAIADEDYATKATLEALRDEAKQSANEAAGSADAAAGSATAAETSAVAAGAEAVAAAASAVTAGASATAAAASAAAALAEAGAAALSALSASSSSSSASSSAVAAQASLDNLLNTKVNLVGDVTASELLTNSIVTTYKQNSSFSGQYLGIPFGNSENRPTNNNIGMIRLTQV